MEERHTILRCKRHETVTRIKVWRNRAGNVFSGPCGGWDELLDGKPLEASCGCRFYGFKLVVGTLDETQKCTAKCRMSFGLKCTCACGGEEHGAEYSEEYLMGLRQ